MHEGRDLMTSLDELNALDVASFVARLGDVVEGAPWIAERSAAARPFETVAQLHQAMFRELEAEPEHARAAVFRNHPELAGLATRLPGIAPHSAAEQSLSDFDRLPAAALARLDTWNKAYRERFGYPFLICTRRHTRRSILKHFERRLNAEPADEHAAALAEIFNITRLRIVDLVEGPGKPIVAGRLSTHVLDTTTGRAAAGVAVELVVIEEEGVTSLHTSMTDANGRIASLVDGGGPLRIGEYELRFAVGAYFAGTGTKLSDPPFLDVIPLRVGIAEAEAHYHVPLLVSAWSFSTYRGS